MSEKAIIVVVTMLFFCISADNNHKIISTGLSTDNTNYILELHNSLRSQVAMGFAENQPPAKNMLEMSWDNELAHKAQIIAEHCEFMHEIKEDRKVYRFKYGQNVASVISNTEFNESSADFVYSIFLWYNEQKYYHFMPFHEKNFSHYNMFKKNDIKHNSLEAEHLPPKKYTASYTQLIWARTHFLGCGYAYCLDIPEKMFRKVYICNYGPGGNVVSEYPYIKGKPDCESFNLKYSTTKGLCLPDNETYEDDNTKTQ